MATTHVLLPMASRSAVESGAAVSLAGRTRLTATLSVASVTGTLDVVVEASPTGAEGTYRTLATLSATVPGTVTKTTADLSVLPSDRVVRARVVTITDAIAELRLVAPWVDTAADAALFSKELRSFADGFARIVGEAEETVMAELLPRPRTGVSVTPLGAQRLAERPWTPEAVDTYTSADGERWAGAPVAPVLDVDLSLPGVGDAIRAAIVRQAEHLFRRHRLTQRDDPAAMVTLRSLPETVPGLMQGLARFRPVSATVWRGR